MPGALAPTAVLGIALSLAACGAVGPPAGRLVAPLSADAAATAREVAARARLAEVVYLGESHDNPHHHRAQVQVLEALLAAGTRPALAFEMVPEGRQAAVDDALRHAETAADGDRRLEWTARGWPDFSMYWPLFALGRRHGLRGVAIDLDPVLARRIAREGLEALGAAGTGLASRLPPDPGREAAIAATIRQAHCDLLPVERLPRMVESWHARNVTIARRLAEAVTPGGLVVVVIGRGHQDPGGVPAQLEVIRPGTRQLVVHLDEAEPGEPGDEASPLPPSGVRWLMPAVKRPDPCRGLRPGSGPTA